MRGCLILLLGLLGLAAGADKVRKLAGINGYISDHPDERCQKIGDFLLHPYNRCSYLVCDYGHEPWKDEYGRTKYYARIMKCAPGTAVPKSAYRHGKHKLDPTKVCTEHYHGKCPAPVHSYGGNFYGSSRYTPRHKYDFEDDHHDSDYGHHRSYGSSSYGRSSSHGSSYGRSRSHGWDDYKPKHGYGLRGGYSYEDRYPKQHSYTFVKKSGYDDHDDFDFGGHKGGPSYGSKFDSHGPSYGSHKSSGYGSNHHGSSYHGKGHSDGYGGSRGHHGPPSHHGPSHHGPSHHGPSHHGPSHRGPPSHHGPSHHGPSPHRSSYHGPSHRRPSHHGHSSSHRRHYHHPRPSFRNHHVSYKPSSHHGDTYGSRPSYGHPFDKGPSYSRSYDRYGYNSYPGVEFKKAKANKQEKYDPEPTDKKEVAYPRKSSSYPPSSYNSYPKKSYNKPHYSKGYNSYKRKRSYPKAGYGKDSYSSKPSYGQYRKDSYPRKPSYVPPGYAKAPTGVDYPEKSEIEYPSAPKDLKYPSAPRDMKYPDAPKYSESGYDHLNNGGPRGPPVPTNQPSNQNQYNRPPPQNNRGAAPSYPSGQASYQSNKSSFQSSRPQNQGPPRPPGPPGPPANRAPRQRPFPTRQPAAKERFEYQGY